MGQERLRGERLLHIRCGYEFLEGGVYNAEIIKTLAGRMGVLPASENRPPHLQSSLPQLRERLQAELSG